MMMQHDGTDRRSNAAALSVPHLSSATVAAPKPPKKRYLASSASQYQQLHDNQSTSISINSSEQQEINTTNSSNNNNNNNNHERKPLAKSKLPVDCAISILDPLMFDQDTLERIIENALSDKTNLTEIGGSSDTHLPAYATSPLSLLKTSHQHQNEHLTRQCAPPSMPYSSHYLPCSSSSGPNCLSTTPTTNGNRVSVCFPDTIRSTNYTKKDIGIKMTKSNAEENERTQNERIHGDTEATEQEKPMDFSVNKTYEQTGQNIINHLIDKIMAQPNDSPFLMMLA